MAPPMSLSLVEEKGAYACSISCRRNGWVVRGVVIGNGCCMGRFRWS
jgi:hypothetical protein